MQFTIFALLGHEQMVRDNPKYIDLDELPLEIIILLPLPQ